MRARRENHWVLSRERGGGSLAARLQRAPFVKAPELDTDALLDRIAHTVVDCLAIGTLSRRTGHLGAYLPCSEAWAGLFSEAATGEASFFPGVRLGALAALLNEISEGKENAAHFDKMSLAAHDARIVFQRCPWDERQVLFAVLPDDAAAATSFSLLRLVLESVRRDVAIVRAPRVEERCLN